MTFTVIGMSISIADSKPIENVLVILDSKVRSQTEKQTNTSQLLAALKKKMGCTTDKYFENTSKIHAC